MQNNIYLFFLHTSTWKSVIFRGKMNKLWYHTCKIWKIPDNQLLFDYENSYISYIYMCWIFRYFEYATSFSSSFQTYLDFWISNHKLLQQSITKSTRYSKHSSNSPSSCRKYQTTKTGEKLSLMAETQTIKDETRRAIVHTCPHHKTSRIFNPLTLISLVRLVIPRNSKSCKI